MKSKRKNDMMVEREVAMFTDKYLYPSLNFKITRTNTLSSQYSGCDLIIHKENEDYLVDEKSAIHFANIYLDSFALEVSSCNNPNGLGWLLDNSKKTTHYMFLWLDKVDIPKSKDTHRYDYTQIRVNNIQEIYYALVKKSDILSYLASIEWNEETIYKQVESIRKNGGINYNKWVNLLGNKNKNHEVKFYYSKHLKEQPIGIMLHRSTFDEIANGNSGKLIVVDENLK